MAWQPHRGQPARVGRVAPHGRAWCAVLLLAAAPSELLLPLAWEPLLVLLALEPLLVLLLLLLLLCCGRAASVQPLQESPGWEGGLREEVA